MPGLPAKPIVDIVIAVDYITAEEDYLPALLGAGYVLHVREPAHRLVRTPARDVHVHILEKSDPAVDRYVAFRNRLRADADDRDLYAKTKYSLIRQGFDTMDSYSDATTEVIPAILGRAVL